MITAFERSLGLPPNSLPEPAFYKCQLWGAALPMNSPKVCPPAGHNERRRHLFYTVFLQCYCDLPRSLARAHTNM